MEKLIDQNIAENKYNTFIDNLDYYGLLNYTNQILAEDQNDNTAFEYKAKALISLKKYEEADFIFSKMNFSPNLQTLERITKKLVKFEKNYEKYSQMVIPISWYEDRMYQEIQKYRKFFLDLHNEFTEEMFELKGPESNYSNRCPNIHECYLALHKYALEQKSKVYILGPEEVVNVFKSFSFRSPVYDLGTQLIYPYAQGMYDGWLFTKEQNYLLPYGIRKNEYFYEGPICVAPFPISDYEMAPAMYLQKDPYCDVYSSDNLIDETTQKMIQHTLDELANETKDYFIPMYHNIIDPNLNAIEQDGIYQWKATDFIIEEVRLTVLNTICALQLCVQRKGVRFGKYITNAIAKFLKNKIIPMAHIASPISNISLKKVELYVAAEQVLSAALPLLSKLTKPALLFPGKLQAVVKAQRIYVKPGEEYDGIWHRDGKHENIVAVVIYYYRVSEQLIGGDLEFIDKRPIQDKLWLNGDCTPEDFTTEQAKAAVKTLPQCRIPVKKGTIVVFSNYQNIHRVLKMTCEGKDANSPDGYASRDFLLFFIVDQGKPLQSTNNDLNILDNRLEIRENLFREQIKPTGIFAPNSGLIYSTGNGTVGQVGWLDGQTNYDFDDERLYNYNEGYRRGFKNVEKMNQKPPLRRGLSWAFE
jgi:tetratricopeptide (TPR) repeat protein